MMEASKIQLSKSEARINRWGLMLGIIIWFLDLNAVYALPSLACKWGWFPFTLARIPGLVFFEGIITLLALALILVIIFQTWRIWRRFQTAPPRDNPHALNDTEKDRRSLMAFVAMLLNGFFFLSIIAFFVPMLALNACNLG